MDNEVDPEGAPGEPTARRAVRDRLGLPELSGHRPLAAALLVDSLGDGLFVPFAIVYFLHTTHLPLQTIGLGISAAGFLALPSVLLAGLLIDRVPASTVVIAANLTSGIAFGCYLTVAHAWQLVLFALLASVGGRLYWTAYLALTSDAFDGNDRSRWFAFQRAVRNAGFGIGGLLGAVAVSAGSEAAYHAAAVLNAASYLAAAALVLRWSRRPGATSPGRTTAHQRPIPAVWTRPRAARLFAVAQLFAAARLFVTARLSQAGARGSRGYRSALTDVPFMLLAATNLLFVLCSLVLDVLLAVFLVRDLHEPLWLCGVLFGVNAILVVMGQTTLSVAVSRLRPARVLQLSAAVWAVSFLLLWLLGSAPRTTVIPGLFVAIAIFTTAEMIQGPALNDLVVAAAPPALLGRYLGAFQLSWALGRAAAPALFSWLLGAGADLPWATLAVACTVWILVLGRLGARLRGQAGDYGSSVQREPE
jgi:MFS family permease